MEKEPTTQVLARLPDSLIPQVDEMAEVFGITRARFVVWATEEALARTQARIEELREMRRELPALPREML